mmetsp:Transcript_8107/g.25004  ORF Transcript_8107/g.25004 Transcript_8107/m.25004 type:complete len:238 (+) Transcript_8107:1048-1761(+)
MLLLGIQCPERTLHAVHPIAQTFHNQASGRNSWAPVAVVPARRPGAHRRRARAWAGVGASPGSGPRAGARTGVRLAGEDPGHLVVNLGQELREPQLGLRRGGRQALDLLEVQRPAEQRPAAPPAAGHGGARGQARHTGHCQAAWLAAKSRRAAAAGADTTPGRGGCLRWRARAACQPLGLPVHLSCSSATFLLLCPAPSPASSKWCCCGCSRTDGVLIAAHGLPLLAAFTRRAPRIR